jgi:LacI family transcriptional regulator
VTGVLRYADAHPTIFVRYFATPRINFAAAVAELEEWGPDGILCFLANGELDELMTTLKRPIPIICNLSVKERPGVFRYVFDFQDFAEAAIGHFRQLGLRSLAFLLDEEGPHANDLVNRFLQFAGQSTSRSATLAFNGNPEKFSDPFVSVKPVPAVLADWLNSLPKPTGVLCPAVGGGGYLIRCCKALGLRVPEDIAVIGADDIDLSLSCEPTLTSVVPPREKLGFESMRLLQDWIAGKPPPGLSAVFRHHMDLHIRGSTGLRKPEICDIAGALKYINENACRGITVAQVIKETQSVSKPTFHRRFQEVTGKSPAEAIRDRKLDEVRRLLTTSDLPLTMVSDLSGFTSAMVLAQIFRAAEGVTMSDYRKTNRIHPPQSGRTKR